jgi:hypothetical protein
MLKEFRRKKACNFAQEIGKVFALTDTSQEREKKKNRKRKGVS